MLVTICLPTLPGSLILVFGLGYMHIISVLIRLSSIVLLCISPEHSVGVNINNECD